MGLQGFESAGEEGEEAEGMEKGVPTDIMGGEKWRRWAALS